MESEPPAFPGPGAEFEGHFGGEKDPMVKFHEGIKTDATRATYDSGLAQFLSFARGTPAGFIRLAREDPRKAEGLVLSYIGSLKAAGWKPSTVRNRLAPLKLLLVMNDAPGLNWAKIAKSLPPPAGADDRAPTLEEVRAIAGDTDPRVKVPVLFMATSGIRIGAFDGMKVKHVEKIEAGGVTLARLMVYAGSREEYQTFIGPEAWNAFESYLKHRRENGEKVTGESPVIRNRYADGEAGRKAVALKPGAIRALLVRRYIRLGIRGVGKARTDRHEFQAAHGLRKLFKTRCEAVMKPLIVEILLGHETGLAGRYYRPRESEILEDYLKALPSLSILSAAAPAELTKEVKALREEVSSLKAHREAVAPAEDFAGSLGRALAAVLAKNPAFEDALKAELAAQNRKPAPVSGRK